MAGENSSSVAIVAIIVIVLLGAGVVYYLSNGFQFNKGSTTIIQPSVQTETKMPSAGTGTSTTESSTKSQ